MYDIVSSVTFKDWKCLTVRIFFCYVGKITVLWFPRSVVFKYFNFRETFSALIYLLSIGTRWHIYIYFKKIIYCVVAFCLPYFFAAVGDDSPESLTHFSTIFLCTDYLCAIYMHFIHYVPFICNGCKNNIENMLNLMGKKWLKERETDEKIKTLHSLSHKREAASKCQVGKMVYKPGLGYSSNFHWWKGISISGALVPCHPHPATSLKMAHSFSRERVLWSQMLPYFCGTQFVLSPF